MTNHEFRRAARRALNKAIWTTLESERATYYAREALARCEAAEAKASTAMECSLEAIQYLAAEVRALNGQDGTRP